MLAARDAIRAVVAGVRRPFPEIAEKVLPQAFAGFGIKRHPFQTLFILFPDLRLLLRRQIRIRLRVLDQPAGGDHILGRVEQDAVRVAAVPPRAAGFLVIGFQALGHIVMDHIGHV